MMGDVLGKEQGMPVTSSLEHEASPPGIRQRRTLQFESFDDERTHCTAGDHGWKSHSNRMSDGARAFGSRSL